MKDWQKLAKRLEKHMGVVAQHDFIRMWVKVNRVAQKGTMSAYDSARKMLLAMPEEEFEQWVVRFRLEGS